MKAYLSTKLRLFIVFLIGILAIFLLIVLARKNIQSPYEYLKKNTTDVIAPSELLYQETLGTDISVVFYVDQHGKYECAILKKYFLGYQIIGYSGSLSMDTDTYLYGSFLYDKKKLDICWGMLADDSITEVFLDDTPCSIVNTSYGGFRIFWMIGSWDDLPSLRVIS